MLTRCLTLGLAAFSLPFALAKAIVTNHCDYPVYLWHVPGDTQRFIIHPNASYFESFLVKDTNLGVALKVSPDPDGIFNGGDELIFAYTVDENDDSRVWLNVDGFRGNPFDGYYTLLGCFGAIEGDDRPTEECNVNDEVELLLCGYESFENMTSG